MKVKLIISMFVLFVAVAAGAPLNLAAVSRQATWVVHCDYDQFRNSLTGQLFLGQLKASGVSRKLDDFAQVFSFHPVDDIQDITIYGRGSDEATAAVLLHGSFDCEQLLALLRLNPEYKEIEAGERTIHSWLDENQKRKNAECGKTMYGTFYTDGLAIISSGLEAVTLAVSVLDGSAANAGSNSVFTEALSAWEGNFFFGAAGGVSDIHPGGEHAVILEQTERLSCSIGEAQGRFYVSLGLAAKSEEAARYVVQMVEGFRAIGLLNREKHPGLAQLAESLEITQNAAAVTVRLASAPETVIELITEQWKNKEETVSENPEQ